MIWTKMKGIIMKVFLTIFFLSFILLCYYMRDIIDMYKYAKAVHKETQERIVKHKAHFKSLTFSGIIEQKLNCDGCDLITFQLVIKINNRLSNEDINADRILHSYYFFENEKELLLSVTKEIFDSCKIGDLVIKDSNSLELKVNNFKHRLLSDEPYKWFFLN